VPLLICLAVVAVHIKEKQKKEKEKSNRYSANYYKKMPEPVAQEELRFTKNIQWSLMYYVLALMGALFVLSNSMTAKWDAISGKKITIFAVSLAAFVYGIYTILNIMIGLRNTRIGISRTDGYKQKYAARYDEYESDKIHDSKLFRDFEYHLPFFISILAIQALIFYKVWPWFHIMVHRILK
jgi:hypothetical protein